MRHLDIVCESCRKAMTPENSKLAPEMFLCDECAPVVYEKHGIEPTWPQPSKEAVISGESAECFVSEIAKACKCDGSVLHIIRTDLVDLIEADRAHVREATIQELAKGGESAESAADSILRAGVFGPGKSPNQRTAIIAEIITTRDAATVARVREERDKEIVRLRASLELIRSLSTYGKNFHPDFSPETRLSCIAEQARAALTAEPDCEGEK